MGSPVELPDGEFMAMRKPRKSLRNDETMPKRNAERQLEAELPQPPPRLCRY